MNSIISSFEPNEPEVSIEINNHQVVFAKHLGMKVLYLFSEAGQGFNIVKVNRIKRMRDEAIKWANDAGVSLSTSGT
ncbi:MAG: hypothetical protein AAF693_19350 [Bacteroidota bacterium]